MNLFAERGFERQAQWRKLIGKALVSRVEGSAKDLEVKAVVVAAISALDVAAKRWGDSERQR